MRSSLLFAIFALPASVACAQAHNVASLAPKLNLAAAAGSSSAVHLELRESIKIQLPESPEQYAADHTTSIVTTLGDDSAMGRADVALAKWAKIEVPAADAAAVANKTLSVRMVINGAGEPQLLEVLDSVSPEVDQIALNTLKQYRFTPATINYVPVAAPAVVRVSFEAK